MTHLPAKDAGDKFRRFRANRKAAGMKLVRLWLPDLRSPEFQARARHEAELLRGASDEQEALDFIDAVAAELVSEG